MKNAVLLLLTCFFCRLPNASAIGNYSTGDKLYVWAYHGLSLRAGPSPKAAKKRTISYGEHVVVLDSVKTQPFSVEDLPGIPLNGYWSKVRCGELEGWVFDGYLSKYPAIEKYTHAVRARNQSWQERFLPYGKKAFGPFTKSRLRIDSDEPTHDSLNCRDVYTFRNGAFIEWVRHQEGDGGGEGEFYVFPDFSFEEAYLLFVYNLDFSLVDPRYNTPDPDMRWPKITEQDEEHLVIEMDLYEYRFEKRDNLTYIVAMTLF